MVLKSILTGFVFAITLNGNISCAQTDTLETLKKTLLLTQNVKSRQEILLKICSQNHSFPPDSFQKYIQIGLAISSPNSLEYLKFLRFKASYLNKLGRNDVAIHLTDSILNLAPAMHDIQLFQRLRIEKCKALIRTGKSKESIAILFDMLEKAETMNDTTIALAAFSLLGWANMELGKYAEAIKWLEKGKNYTSTQTYFIQNPALYANLGSSYNNVSNYEKALAIINQGLDQARKGENLTITANALNIRADIYINLKKNDKAQHDLEESLNIREQIGDEYYMLSDMAQLALFYATSHQYDKGIALANKGISRAQSGNHLSKIIYLYEALAENYKQSYQSREYATTLSTLLILKDSLYRDNTAKALADLEGKYEYQKSQNTIIRQQNRILRNRYSTYGMGLLLLVTIVVFAFVYRNFKRSQKRKLAALTLEQNKLAEEAVRKAEENERKRIAADLHDNLGTHVAAICSGVKYFKEGNLDHQKVLTQLDANATDIMNHLNDTIWVLKNEKLLFINLADRFKLWIQRVMKNYPNIKYFITENINEDIALTPIKILHLFLMMKEALNNALKHSECSEIRIHFQCTDSNEWQVCITDNGVGFDVENPMEGNGIRNLKLRAKASNFKVIWNRIEPSGTEILFKSNNSEQVL
jgi:two-component system, NarL family, sensor kinase